MTSSSRMEPNATLDLNATINNDTITKPLHSTFEATVIAIVLSIVILGTIIGNILVCVAVCLVRKLRRPCNYLLVSLAVSDLCVAILVMPPAMINELRGWMFGKIACNLWVSCDVLSCTASILNLCMISVDRYNAITKPLEYGVKRTPKRMIIYVFLVWFGAACISLPPLLILGNKHEAIVDNEPVEVCIICQELGYQIYATMCSFYIPLAVMILVYYKIFRAARKIVLEEKRAQSHLDAQCYLEISVKNGGGPPENKISMQSPAAGNQARANHRSSSGSTNTVCSLDKIALSRCFTTRRSNESQCPMLTTKQQQQAKQPSKQKQQKSALLSTVRTSPSTHHNQKKLRFQLAKERKASTTLGIIMSAFTICWLPFFVLALIRPLVNDIESHSLNTLASVFLWLGYANSLLNPIIYATLNRDFRKPFQEILFFRCGSLNHMMREEFYHSQYGDPDHHVSARCHLDYEEGVEYIEAGGEETKVADINAAHESFL